MPLRIVAIEPDDDEPNDALVSPDTLFTHTEYIPPSREELAQKIERIKRNLGKAWLELVEIAERKEWKASYASWDDMCKQEFNFTGNWGYKLCKMHAVNHVLAEAGHEPVKERIARTVTDLPPQQQVEVVAKGKEIAERKAITGYPSRYHKPGQLTSRIMEQARAEVVPEDPHPHDAPLTPPIPPKKPIERKPTSMPVFPYDVRPDIEHTGLRISFEIDGCHYNIHLRGCEWRRFYPENE